MAKYVDNIVIENGRIIFRNFAGKEDKFNAEGNRHFSTIIDPSLVETLKADGWNIKTLEPRDPADDPAYYLKVGVSYKNVPPKIWLISGGKKQLLDESNVNILDWAEISNVDLIISPYRWEVGSKSGIKAYIRTMYVTIAEDEFTAKYKDVPDAGSIEEEES